MGEFQRVVGGLRAYVKLHGMGQYHTSAALFAGQACRSIGLSSNRNTCESLRLAAFRDGMCHYHTSTTVSAGQRWRRSNGLPSNPNSYGSLTDLPDYSFLDGRRTPAGSGKLRRALEQQDIAGKIIQMTKEVNFAVEYRAQRQAEEESRRQKIIDRKLKPKGEEQRI